MPPAKRHAALGSCGHGFTQQAPSPSLQTKLFRCATHDTLNERALIKQFVHPRRWPARHDLLPAQQQQREVSVVASLVTTTPDHPQPIELTRAMFLGYTVTVIPQEAVTLGHLSTSTFQAIRNQHYLRQRMTSPTASTSTTTSSQTSMSNSPVPTTTVRSSSMSGRLTPSEGDNTNPHASK